MAQFQSNVNEQTGLRPHLSRSTRRETPSSDSFLDDRILDGLPSYSAADFKNPRLRRCRFSLDDIDWRRSKHLGSGLDGHSWQVFFDSNVPYVLKMFWDQEHPTHYFAPERECQNASILAMIEASINHAAAASTRIQINPCPMTRKDAKKNFNVFAKESLESNLQSTEGLLGILSMPRFRKCYGWLKISGQNCPIPQSLLPPTITAGKEKRRMLGDGEHIAIVYEHIEEGENVEATVEDVSIFLWRAGFSFTNYASEGNWKSGVLVDMSEMAHVRGYGWIEKIYASGPRNAQSLLGIPYGAKDRKPGCAVGSGSGYALG